MRAAESPENMVTDAVGPETFTFAALVDLIRTTVRSRAKIVHVHPRLALFLSWVAGRVVNDVILTRDEVGGLMANLLVSSNPPAGMIPLSRWLAENAARVGLKYASELGRHYR